MSCQAAFDQQMELLLGVEATAHRIGVAVSGGGDSMALLALATDWAARGNRTIEAISIDHGLRPEASAEIALAADLCAKRGIKHAQNRWEHDKVEGNLQDTARNARYALIAKWAMMRGIDHVLLGHTLDDQGETVLMRLARGSGVDGLSAMTPASRHGGVTWLRPLLGTTRASLRRYLEAAGLSWAEDPSNEDTRFDRVRARRALAVLEPLGIDAAGLSETASHMARARAALEDGTVKAARILARVDAAGDVVFDRAGLVSQPSELRLRLLAHALCWVASAIYRPRFSGLSGVDRAVVDGNGRITLHGCLVSVKDKTVRIGREFQAVRVITAQPGSLWDRRWLCSGPEAPGLEIRALGHGGLSQLPDWRDSGLSRESLLATPATWKGDALWAAPVAGFANGWRVCIEKGCDDFYASIKSH